MSVMLPDSHLPILATETLSLRVGFVGSARAE
jgi:hypothetical protein